MRGMTRWVDPRRRMSAEIRHPTVGFGDDLGYNEVKSIAKIGPVSNSDIEAASFFEKLL
jgi:hypothetical protein